jgi:hypothetical protein
MTTYTLVVFGFVWLELIINTFKVLFKLNLNFRWDSWHGTIRKVKTITKCRKLEQIVCLD